MSDDVVYSSTTLLFTLNGLIAVQFMDGEVIEGEFATQDAFNVFLKVDGEPLMIPRQQIRLIKGLQGQEIKEDSSQEGVLAGAAPEQSPAVQPPPSETQPAPSPGPTLSDEIQPDTLLPAAPDLETQPEPPTAFGYDTEPDLDVIVPSGPAPEEPTPPPVFGAADDPVEEEDEDEDEDDGTLIIVPDRQLYSDEDDDEDDGTLILPAGSDLMQDMYDDKDDGTLILPPKEQTSPSAGLGTGEEEDELDMTVILGESADMDAFELDEKDSTIAMVLDEETELTGTLVCTGGPHAGETFQLNTEITTVGRASDNMVILFKDKEISRHHSLILREPDGFLVQDQNSLNGTFVNNEHVTSPRHLVDGDVILVGVSVLKLELD